MWLYPEPADVWTAPWYSSSVIDSAQKSVWFSDCVITGRLSKLDFNSTPVLSQVSEWKANLAQRAYDFFCFLLWALKSNVNMVNVGTNDRLICSFSLKICASSLRNPYLSDRHLFGSSEMKPIGPTWFVPPGLSLSWVSSQHFFTGRMLQIRAAHCVLHALHRHRYRRLQ